MQYVVTAMDFTDSDALFRRMANENFLLFIFGERDPLTSTLVQSRHFSPF